MMKNKRFIIISALVVGAILALSTKNDTQSDGNKKLLTRIDVIPLNGPAGKLGHMVVSKKHNLLFMGNKVNASLDIVDIKNNTLMQQHKEQEGCSGIDYDPENEYLMISSGKNGCYNLFKYNNGKYDLLKKIKMGGCSKIEYNYYDKNFYMQKKIDGQNFITVFDPVTLENTHDISLPAGHYSAIVASSVAPRLYLNGKNMVLVVDTEKKEVVDTLPVTLSNVNKPIILDEEQNRIFVGCRKPPKVVVFDSKTGDEITSVDIKGDLDDFSFDPKRKRIYASCGEGFISVVQQIDPDNYELIDTIPTQERARTGVYSPGLDLYFVGIERADSMKAPEIWVYKPE